jgi:hypothetical protein
MLLSHSLAKLRETFRPADRRVERVLGASSPEERARSLVSKSMLGDAAERCRLWSSDGITIQASNDSMIELACLVDSDGRGVRRKYEDEIAAGVRSNEELISRARFEKYGAAVYPDGSSTLRLSAGKVEGWTEEARNIGPFTTMGEVFARASGRSRFHYLPPGWPQEIELGRILSLILPLRTTWWAATRARR